MHTHTHLKLGADSSAALLLFLQQIPNVQKYKDIDTLDSDKITVT
jgi:hypothetical protein